jgi:CD109 antigen
VKTTVSLLSKLAVILLEDSAPCRVSGSISRDGVAISTNWVEVHPEQAATLMLNVPPDTTGEAAKEKGTTAGRYRLRVEGVMIANRMKAGGIVFEHDRPLEFSRKFLSILISTNKVIYNAEHLIRIRVLMLTTSLRPYEGIADLFLIDPDGFIIRKWNSKELNVGVITEDFLLPMFPKVKRYSTSKGRTRAYTCTQIGWLLDNPCGR